MKYLDRDQSWIRFNTEVLEEAEKKLPLAERVLFYGITGDNMREFCMVRYPAQVELDTDEGLKDFQNALAKHYLRYVKSWKKFNKDYELVRKVKDLKDNSQKWAEKEFKNEIFPALQPITVTRTKLLNVRPGTFLLVITEDKEKDQERLS